MYDYFVCTFLYNLETKDPFDLPDIDFKHSPLME